MAVRAGNKPGLQLLVKSLTLFILLVYYSCKKQEAKVITETVPPLYNPVFSATLNFIKTPFQSFDTTVSFDAGYYKTYPVTGKLVFEKFNQVSCNNRLLTLDKQPTNCLMLVSPNCKWQANSNPTKELFFTDTNPFPTFTSTPWLNVDSIHYSTDFVFDFNSFKNYDIINLFINSKLSLHSQFYTITSTESKIIIPKDSLKLLVGINTINISASKLKDTVLNSFNARFSKNVSFMFNKKIY